MALMNLDNEKDVIKQSYLALNLITLMAIASGILTWFFMPFLTDQHNNPKHQLYRILSLIYTTGSGGVALFGAKKLARLDKYVTALNKAEDNTFINNLATAQYTEQKKLESESEYKIILTKSENGLLPPSEGEEYEEEYPSEINGVKLQDYHWEILDFARGKKALTARDLQRSGIGQRLTLNASTARDILSDLAKAELGKIEGEDDKIKFLPVS